MVARDPSHHFHDPAPDLDGPGDIVYTIAEERPPRTARALGDEYSERQWRAAPAKRVRTTLGRNRPRNATSDDEANARLVAALRPGAMDDGERVVRAMEPGTGTVTPRRPRPAPVRYLRPLVVREPFVKRWLFAAVANFFALAFMAILLGFWAPAHTGVEQNAYLVGGRLLAEHGTMRFVPDDPFAFVSTGWVAAQGTVQNSFGQEVQAYFPKYPAGLPAIYALILRAVPNQDVAIDLVHLVSPVCATLAVLGMFYLGRFAGGSFLGALSMLALAGTQVLLLLADNPSSHAPALAFAIWGFVSLLSWWRTGGIIRGLLAGLLLGYAFSIRYTEGLLGLPLGLACLFAFEWRRPFASGWRVLAPVTAWLIPVIGLMAYNHQTMGALLGFNAGGQPRLDLSSFLDGSGAFTVQNLQANWEIMARQLNDTGLYFLLPLGVMGLLAMLARRVGIGLVMLSWVVGTVVIYTAYPWAEPRGIAHLQFFLVAFAPVLFGAAYLLRRVLNAPSDSAPQRVEMQERDGTYRGRDVRVIRDPQRGSAATWRNIFGPVAAGLVVAVAVAIGTHRAVGALPETPGASLREPGLQVNFTQAANAAVLGKLVRQLVPEGSVVFMDAPGSLDTSINHVQYVGDYELYEATMFTSRFARTLGEMRGKAGSGSAANPLPERGYDYLQALYADKADAVLTAEVRRIIDRALDDGREVYLVMKTVDKRRFRQAHLAGDYDAEWLEISYDELPPVYPPDAQAPQRPAPADVNQWQIVRVRAARP